MKSHTTRKNKSSPSKSINKLIAGKAARVDFTLRRVVTLCLKCFTNRMDLEANILKPFVVQNISPVEDKCWLLHVLINLRCFA